MSSSTPPRSPFIEAFDLARNVPAEQKLLASILFDPDECLSQGLDEVHAEMFTTPLHCEVWREIVETRRRGERIDASMIGERVASRVDVLEYARLGEAVPSAASFPDHLAACVGARRKRVFVEGIQRVMRLAVDPAIRADDLEQLWDQIAHQARHLMLGREAEAMSTILPRVIEDLVAGMRGDRGGRVPTDFNDFDRMFDGGLRPGTLTVLAARPSMGKTTLALQIACAVAKLGEPVLFVSLEMSAMELGAKVLARVSGLSSHALRGGVALNEAAVAELYAGADLEGKFPLYVAEPSRCTWSRIQSTVRQEVSRRGARLVVLDYLQLVQTDGRYANRYEQVSTISRELKLLARELQIPLLVLAQLNRQADTRPKNRPPK